MLVIEALLKGKQEAMKLYWGLNMDLAPSALHVGCRRGGGFGRLGSGPSRFSIGERAPFTEEVRL
jgi:hypothetical protein